MISGAVDAIIPTYRPDEKLIRLVELLEKQTVPVRNIYIINTDKDFWDEFTGQGQVNIESRYDNIHVSHIAAGEFDHGGTRRRAVELSDAEYFIMMTQDALPCDETLAEMLLAPMGENPKIAVSCARQLPYPAASEAEKYVRGFNYPKEAVIKSKKDIDVLGIKTYFCSNVCAAYRRSIYDELGGFVSKAIFNEDMIYAASAINAGFYISYTPEAKVYHSHDYTALQQLHRNFDLAVSQAEHPEVFGGLKSEGEGAKLVKEVVTHLRKVRKSYLIPGFVINCGFRYLGFLLGKRYRLLPRAAILKLTGNKVYWKKEDKHGRA